MSLPDLAEAIRKSVEQGGDEDALAFEGRWRSWRWIGAVAGTIDRLVADLALGAGQGIGLVARNRPQHVAAVAAQIMARRTTAMIYSAQSPAAIAADIRRLRAPVIVAEAADWTAETQAAAREAGSVAVALTDGDGRSSATILAGLDRIGPGLFAPPTPSIAFELLSSGTTGAPKRIPLAWSAVASAVADAKSAYAGSGAGTAPVIMSHPLGNVSGVAYAIPALVYGQRLVLLERFAIGTWVEAVRRYRPTRSSLPPAGVRMVLEAGVPRAALDSLHLVAVGGGKLDPDVQAAFEHAYGIPVLTAFGATEFGGVVANWALDDYRRFGAAKRGSAGRASANVALRVVDRDTFAPLAFGEIGLLEAQVSRIGPDWVRTTDLASLDEDGFLFLHGRADGAINRGGFKIVPDVVAAVLIDHPAVADAAVVGLPDARLGAVPVAAVEIATGAGPIDEAALKLWLRDRLLAYQVPVAIRIVDALPRNPAMKISLPEVVALFARSPA